MRILNFNDGNRLIKSLENHCKKHRFKKINFFIKEKKSVYYYKIIESFNFIDTYNKVIFSIKDSKVDSRGIFGKNNFRYIDRATHIFCGMTHKERARYIKKLNNI
jgi:hypothetical protein